MMCFYTSYNIRTSKAKMSRSAHPEDRDLFPSPEKRQANIFKFISLGRCVIKSDKDLW